MVTAIDIVASQPFLTVVVMGLICSTSRALSASEIPLAVALKSMYVDLSACFVGYVVLESVTHGGSIPSLQTFGSFRAENGLELLGAIALLLLAVTVAKQRNSASESKLRSDALISAALMVGLALFFFNQKAAGTTDSSKRALRALQEYCRVQASEGSDPLAQAAVLTAYFLEKAPQSDSLEPTFAGRWRNNPALPQRPETGRWRAERQEGSRPEQAIGSKDLCRAVELLAHSGLSD